MYPLVIKKFQSAMLIEEGLMKHLHRKILTAASVVCLAALLGGCAFGFGGTSTYTVTMSEKTASVFVSAEEMLEEIRPTVVDVTSVSATGASAGSGVIIGAATDGTNEYFIVTNHHVIEGGTTFTVDVLSIAEDDTESTTVYSAALVGSSLKRDIAVLAVRPPRGTELTLASFVDDSDTVKVGTEVFAIGNPLGILGGTVTHGIVSATKRAVAVSGIGTMTLMQTDTSINGGNSGGGLFDSAGRLVGIINSGYDSYNGQNVEGLNFAIPANDAKYAAEALIETHVESGGTVSEYGYVKGDARMDLNVSTATLFTSSALDAQSVYLTMSAASAQSPLYSAWSTGSKAVVSVTVNGETHSFLESGTSSYSLTRRANDLIAGIAAGDTVTIAYRDILTRSAGFFGSYSYTDSTVREVTFTASQYIYKP